VDACKSHGFFVLQDHGITLIEELFAQSKAIFDLPRDVKNTIKVAHTLRGYSAPRAEVLDPENQTGFESKVSYSNESKAAWSLFAHGADAHVHHVITVRYHVLVCIFICCTITRSAGGL
jgi:isopenicillin N synthase-like dioxygenase